MKGKGLWMAVALAVAIALPLTASGKAEKGAAKQVRIGVSMSTLDNPFFVTMKNGGEKTAEKLGVQLIVLDAKDDMNKQVADIQDLIARKVDGLILNPVDSDAIGTVVKEANKAKIPVITVTRPSLAGDVIQHIDSDNIQGGQLIAQEVVRALGGKGKVIELEGIPGAPSTRERGEGFSKGLAAAPGIAILAKQTANYNRQQGLQVTENLLTAHPDVNAIFAHNDEMALGAVQAVKAANKKNILIYGFDGTDEAVAAVKQGDMAATVEQQPALEMEMAVEHMLDFLKGKAPSEKLMLASLRLVTASK